MRINALAPLLLTIALHTSGAVVDPSFDPGSGVDGEVVAIVAQPDGKTLIAGAFTTVRDALRRGIARLNPDGSNDSEFIAGTERSVTGMFHSMHLLPDGKILAGGSFSAGNASRLLVRLEPDGSIDTNFAAITGGGTAGSMAAGTVMSINLYPDGRILIAGSFSTINGFKRNSIARLHSDGSLDHSFQSESLNFHDRPIYATALLPEERILVGGSFGWQYDYLGLVRLASNGTLDSSYSLGVGIPIIEVIKTQSDGKLLIGGYFTNIAGVPQESLARLHRDGSLDQSFQSAFRKSDPTGQVTKVTSIVPRADGRMILGGFLRLQSGATVPCARFLANGSLDESFNSVNGIRVSAQVQQPDGKILVAADVDSNEGVSRKWLARLHDDGNLDPAFGAGTGVNNTVSAMILDSDGKLTIGGPFTSIHGVSRTNLARLNADGTLDRSFNPYAGVEEPRMIVAQPDGKMLVLGWSSFTRVNRDGSQDKSFQPAAQISPRAISSIEIQPDGKTLVAGNFTVPSGISAGVLRLTLNGSIDEGFQSVQVNPNGVAAIESEADGGILIGGHFTSVNGVPMKAIARLEANGSLDSGFMPYPYLGSVGFITVQPGRGILVGNTSSTILGGPYWRISRLNFNGTIDTNFAAIGSGEYAYLKALKVQSDGQILVGDDFRFINGERASGVYRLGVDGIGDNSFGALARWSVFPVPSGLKSLVVTPDEKVLIGGQFTSVNGVARAHIARLLGDVSKPVMSVTLKGPDLILKWPTNNNRFLLEESPGFSEWTSFASTPLIEDQYYVLKLPIFDNRRFFRLKE